MHIITTLIPLLYLLNVLLPRGRKKRCDLVEQKDSCMHIVTTLILLPYLREVLRAGWPSGEPVHTSGNHFYCFTILY